MRISCNGCRVLRKACGEDCVIGPCLKWIATPASQSHATLFLAKFYGRAGLLNLLSSGPVDQRPAIFRSLLYEACGRIIDPVYGSVGLLHSGHWESCQSAVDAVLRGVPISPVAATSANGGTLYDVRHVSKDESLVNPPGLGKSGKAARARSKRTRVKTKEAAAMEPDQDQLDTTRSDSHGSSLSHQSDGADDVRGGEGESKSVDVAEIDNNEDDGLELTLAVRPIKKRRPPAIAMVGEDVTWD